MHQMQQDRLNWEQEQARQRWVQEQFIKFQQSQDEARNLTVSAGTGAYGLLEPGYARTGAGVSSSNDIRNVSFRPSVDADIQSQDLINRNFAMNQSEVSVTDSLV